MFKSVFNLALIIGTLTAGFSAHAEKFVSIRPGESIGLWVNEKTTVYCENNGGGGNPWDPQPPQVEECSLSGYGQYGGWSYEYRLSQGSTVIFGTGSLSTLLSKLQTMVEAGICRPHRGSCSLAGYGQFGGWSYENTIKVDGVTVYGTGSLDNAIQTMSTLKREGLCF